MPIPKPLIAALALVAFPLASAAAAKAAPVTIDVSGIHRSKGHVIAAICPKESFMHLSCPYVAKAPAQKGVTTVVFPDIPPGTYAAQIFQDENDNDEVDRNALGIPEEGVGFSNDAPIRMRGPKFIDAAFQVADAPVRLKVKLRFFTPW
jgi:uncharacterized protein (DUF2141 family)